MAIGFVIKDIMHTLLLKFVRAFLPEAKKNFYLKAVYQPELDIHGVASKAAIYDVGTSPKVIEEGVNAFMELVYYLTADGFKITTPLFSIRIRVPGEYDGSETSLPPGIFPVARLQVSADFRKYLKEKVQVQIDGKEETDGFIAQAIDEATGLVDEAATIGNVLTLNGYGMKLETAPGHHTEAAIFFKPPTGLPTEVSVIAVNEPRTIKLIVPATLTVGTAYQLVINTMSSVKSGHPTKVMRDMRSEFTLTAQN
jgi:hypothetical protein